MGYCSLIYRLIETHHTLEFRSPSLESVIELHVIMVLEVSMIIVCYLSIIKKEGLSIRMIYDKKNMFCENEMEEMDYN